MITNFITQFAQKGKKPFLYFAAVVLSIISANNVLGQSKANPTPNSPLVVCTQATSAAAPSTVCDGGTTVLTLSSVDAGVTTYQWQLSTDGGTVWNNVVTGSGGTTNTYTSGVLNSGTTYKFRCNTSGTCTVKASTVVTITPPTIAGGTPTATSPVCTGSTSSLSLAGETTAGCTRQWQQKIGAGAWANFGTGVDPQVTGALTNPNSYTYQCIITHTASGCTETSTITAALVPDAAATVATAGTDQNLCGVSTGTMAGNVPTVGSGVWTSSTGVTFGTSTSATSTFANATGTETCTWTITNGACSSTDNVTITKGNVIAGGTPSTTAVCTGSTSSLTLAGETTSGCTRQWQQKIGAGAWANIGTGTDPQATGALTNPNSYTFQCIITETATGCTATSTTTAALVPDAAATVSAAGPDQIICAGNMAICAPLSTATGVMAANTPGAGETGLWTKVSGSISSVTTTSSGTSAYTILTGSAVWRWTITNGACTSSDDITITQNTSSALIAGTATAAPTSPCTGGVALLGITGEYSGNVQWEQNINAGGWTTIAGATSAAYTTGALTNPNSYQYRVKFSAAAPCVNYNYSNTVTVTPATIPAAGASTNYTFTSPTLTLSTPMGGCTATYTFGETAPATNAYINSGVTLTVSGLLTGTDATTMTSGSCGGVAINMATVVKTATSVSFTTPAALCGNFTIVLNGITNPPYGAGTGSASVSVPNRTTGTNSGTYTYYVADHVGDYFDYNGSMVAADITYTNQNDSAHCYHNLSVGVHCFSYINPGSGTVTVGTIMDPGTSGCSSSNGGFAQASGGGNAEAGSTQYQQLYVNSTCASYPGVATAAGSCLTTGATYTMCFTVPAGCAGENFCPLINCSTGNCGNSALPIELLYFDAKLNGRVVDLHWATSSEINNDFFTVERTMDGNVFFSFVEVKGAGNSTSPLQYSSVDEHPFPGISYYRLKQTDYDGKFAYSQLVAINRNDLKELDIKYVLGNKDRNALQYQLSSANDSGISITIFDVLGKIVLTDRIGSSPDGQTLYMDASGLSRGVYIMKVFDGEHMAVKKFLY
jgi:hypothetical protein